MKKRNFSPPPTTIIERGKVAVFIREKVCEIRDGMGSLSATHTIPATIARIRGFLRTVGRRGAAGHDVGPNPVKKEVTAEGEEQGRHRALVAQESIADGNAQKDVITVSGSQEKCLSELTFETAHPCDHDGKEVYGVHGNKPGGRHEQQLCGRNPRQAGDGREGGHRQKEMKDEGIDNVHRIRRLLR